MNGSLRTSKPRSYIFDVPTRSHIYSSADGENLKFEKDFLSYGSSIGPRSRSNSFCPDENTQDISDRKLDFFMEFLLYVYTQVGYNRLRTILSCFKQKNTTESLPLNRKVSELDIFAEEDKKVSQKFSRNRSME